VYFCAPTTDGAVLLADIPENCRKIKYENCYLFYANEFYFTARTFPHQQNTLFAVPDRDYYNEAESTILETQRFHAL